MLALQCSSQVRTAGPRLIGFDMGAVLAVADALGIDRTAAAVFLPEIEVEIVRNAARTLARGTGAMMGEDA